MTRLLIFLFLLCAGVQPAFAQDAVTGWVMIPEESTVVHMPVAGDPRTVTFQHMSSDIRFDPTRLKDSHFVLSVSFTAPGEMAGAETTQGGLFMAQDIRKMSGNMFEARGKMMIAGREVNTTIPFTAGFDKASATPKLVLEGNFRVNTPQYAQGSEAAKYPNEVPVSFRIVTEPLTPLADGVPAPSIFGD